MGYRKKRQNLTEPDLFIINKFRLPTSRFMIDSDEKGYYDTAERKLFYVNLCSSLKLQFSEEWYSTRELHIIKLIVDKCHSTKKSNFKKFISS